MDLLSGDWIPVTHDGDVHQLNLKTLLCTDTAWELTLPRDDMELAALQLLICLVQVMFAPDDNAGLRERIARPLDEAEYDTAAKVYCEWFDLAHLHSPFMQSRGVAANDVTPIQKLFIGLPEGNNHSFFDPEGAISAICGGCAAIALFNQASCCPSIGGGFKGALRGSAPITTLVDAPDLRRRIWENVLTLAAQRVWHEAEHRLPTWIDPIRPGEKLHSVDIGLPRGLFWQPARVELIARDVPGVCDSCGHVSEQMYVGFNKEKFNYTVDGLWRHPHSPMFWTTKKGQIEQRYASFTTTAPAWTQLTQFLTDFSTDEKEGHRPAAVVSEFQQRSFGAAGSIGLLIGGYRNKQASVLERRHELFSFQSGWVDSIADLTEFVQIGLRARKALYGSLMWAAKGQKDVFKGIGVDLHKAAERAFYDRSESLMHERLRELDFSAADREKASLNDALRSMVHDLYDEAISPYAHDAELVHAIAAGRTKLFKELKSSEGIA